MDTKQSLRLAGLAVLLALAACASPQKAPGAGGVAVERNAVAAGAGEVAPDELAAARAKMFQANQALAAKDYKRARELAIQAEADAKLARSKANSARSTAASNAVNDELRVLRQELDRTNLP